MRFARVVFGVTSSLILNATIRYHVNQYAAFDPEFVQEVLKSLYVDDYASASSTVSSTVQLCKKIKSRLDDEGFNMRKWESNSRDVLEKLQDDRQYQQPQPSSSQMTSVSEEDQGYDQSVFAQSRESIPKVLGQRWNNLSDELEFEFTRIVNAAETEIITKRIILSIATRFYDPVGLISPIALPFKLIFQELCQKALRWDDPVDENICSKWKALIRHLREVGTISLK